MKRLLADASWVLYITQHTVPTIENGSKIRQFIRQLHRKWFGLNNFMLVVVKKDHPIVPDFACVLLDNNIKKFTWDSSRSWLFLSIRAHKQEQLEELKDRFITISQKYPTGGRRSELERVG